MTGPARGLNPLLGPANLARNKKQNIHVCHVQLAKKPETLSSLIS